MIKIALYDSEQSNGFTVHIAVEGRTTICPSQFRSTQNRMHAHFCNIYKETIMMHLVYATTADLVKHEILKHTCHCYTKDAT